MAAPTNLHRADLGPSEYIDVGAMGVSMSTAGIIVTVIGLTTLSLVPLLMIYMCYTTRRERRRWRTQESENGAHARADERAPRRKPKVKDAAVRSSSSSSSSSDHDTLDEAMLKADERVARHPDPKHHQRRSRSAQEQQELRQSSLYRERVGSVSHSQRLHRGSLGRRASL